MKIILAKRLTPSSDVLDNSAMPTKLFLASRRKAIRKQMKHHNHYHYPEVKNAKLHARAEAALDLLAAIAIGVGMAVLLVAWWSV